jgi:hypothetical protein
MSELSNNRIGMFTGSEIYKLIPLGKRPMTDEELAAREKGSRKTTVEDGFSDTGITYILSKATERLTGQYTKPEVSSAATDWGKNLEEEAGKYFEAATGLVTKKPECIVGELLSGSPDLLIIGQEIGIEIKCPYDSTNHFKNLLLKTPEQLKELHPEYYWQCYAYMLLTGYRKWKFCSYDPRFKGAKRMMILNIEAIDSELQLLKSRIKEANVLLLNYLNAA